MLSIAQVSGLINAAIIIGAFTTYSRALNGADLVLVQYLLSAAIAVLLVKSAGNKNSAVTW